MRRLAALAFVVTASCAAEQVKPVDIARQHFEAWAKATAAGDVDKNFAGLSDAMKSEWLYDRLEENDFKARHWRGELTGSARTDLDLWWGMVHRVKDGRAEILRSSVLTHPTFLELYRSYFKVYASRICPQFAKLEIVRIYGDDTGITVVVKSGQGAPPEMYGLIYEHDSWQVNLYKPPLTSQK